MLKEWTPILVELYEFVWTSEAEQVIADRVCLRFMFCFWCVVCEPILTFLDVIIVQNRSDAPVSLFQLYLLEICFMSCYLVCWVVSQFWHFWTSSLCKRARMHLFHSFNFICLRYVSCPAFYVLWANFDIFGRHHCAKSSDAPVSLFQLQCNTRSNCWKICQLSLLF